MNLSLNVLGIVGTTVISTLPGQPIDVSSPIIPTEPTDSTATIESPIVTSSPINSVFLDTISRDTPARDSNRNPVNLPLPRPSDQLPPLPSRPPEPAPPLQVPAPVEPPVTPSIAPEVKLKVKQIEVVGNTILQDEIAALVKPFENREVTFEELVELREQITQLYLDRGYMTSGAFLPNNQNLNNGVIQIQVVEGKLETIQIEGLTRLGDNYVRSRLERANTVPLRQQDLERALQILQIDPLIEQVNAELTAGSNPGLSVLQVSLREAPPLQAGVFADNYQSPSIGSEELGIFASFTNIFGLGDRINGQFSLTRGLDLYDFSYIIPVNALDGAFILRYNNSDSVIIEDEFEDLDIQSESETYTLLFRQPLIKTPTTEFALGLGFDLRRSQTYILGDEPFSFSEGAEDGLARASVLRLSQDWVTRGRTRVLAARSEFRLGLDLFDATINDIGTDGQFISWLGQFQWVEQLPARLVLVSRVNAQLTPDSLLSMERFSIGGIETVRGYAQNQVVADSGVSGTVELRIPLTDDPTRLQLVPFIDAGYAWNNKTPDPEDDTLVGVGLGVRWMITPDLDLRLDYGIPLITVLEEGDSLQEQGFYFSLKYQPF